MNSTSSKSSPFFKNGSDFFIWLRTKKVFGTSMQTCATSSIKFVLKHLMHASMHFGHKRNSFKIADSFFQGILDRFRSRFSQATSKKFSYIYHTTINKKSYLKTEIAFIYLIFIRNVPFNSWP